MELTKKQQEGLELALDRYKNGEDYTIIAGYAGSGKSTLVKFIISALPDIDPETDVVYTSFTGKATQVLSKKGNKNTSTLHKLLFHSVPKPDGGFIRKRVSSIDYKVVVVDEISMVPKSLMDHLLSYSIHVIGLGDPFQLPPVDKNEDNHLLDHPHIFLDEIMRQAAESEIIQLTMKIRNGEPIDYFKGKEVQVLKRSELNTGMMQWADQILVATNATRNKMNSEMRELLGHGTMPEDGDKVICCRNYWEKEADDGSILINGSIGTLKDVQPKELSLPKYLNANVEKIDLISSNFIGEGQEDYGRFGMDQKLILEGQKSLDWRTEYRLAKSSKYANAVPYEFTYGYAITCHRSQGSEWNKVLVIEERFPFDKEEHARWLYTACTRASEKLVLIRD